MWLSLICSTLKTSIYYYVEVKVTCSRFCFSFILSNDSSLKVKYWRSRKAKMNLSWILAKNPCNIQTPCDIYPYANTTKFIEYAVHTKIVYKSILVHSVQLLSWKWPKWLENSKWALVCCSDEWRGWVCNNIPESKNCVSTSPHVLSFHPLELTGNFLVTVVNSKTSWNINVQIATVWVSEQNSD